VSGNRRGSGTEGVPRGRFDRPELLIVALALLVRLVYLVEIAKSPTFHVPIIDSATYDQHARLLVAKGIFYERFFWQGFLYPFYLAVVYFLTHGSTLAARLIQIVLGSLVCAGVFRIGSRIFDRRTGIVAGVIAALYGPLVYYDAELLDTTFSAVWAVALLLILLGARGSKGPWRALFFGVCGGLAVITRATFLPFVLAAFAWLVAVRLRAGPPRLRGAATAGLILAGFLAVTMPVGELCRRATGDFNFLSESGPINLYIGNNPERSKTIMIRPGSEWRELTRMPMVHGSASDSQDRGVFLRLFLDYVKRDPVNFLEGLNEKTVEFLSSRELPRNEDLYIARRYSSLFSVLTWKAGTFGFPFGLLLPFALVGLWRGGRRVPVPVYGFLLLYPAAVIAVFVSGRYRIPVVPVLAVPAAAGALLLVDAIRDGRRLAAAAVACAVAALAAASSVAGPFVVERYNYEAEMHTIVGFELMKQHRMDAALAELTEALRLDPERGEAQKYIGLVLSEERRWAEAAAHLRLALERDPDSYLIRYYLGVTLLNLGKRQEALPLLERARRDAAAAKEGQLVHEIDRVLGSLAAPRPRSGTQPADPPRP
jgi:4-amino-4-deoxy-L-arabinose transferase-like glycosyltransferase